MSLNKKQMTFLEAFDTYLNQDTKLGLKGNDKDDLNDQERVNGSEYARNEVYSKFRDKLFKANIVYVDLIINDAYFWSLDTLDKHNIWGVAHSE